MMEYILKSAITLALLYSLFFAFLSRETFHRFNRVCLLLIMLASLVVPFVHLTVSHPTMVQEAVQMPVVYLRQMPIVSVSSGEGTMEDHLTWGQLLTYVYLAGVGAMLILLCVQTLHLYRLMRGGLRHTDNRGNTVILKDTVRSPFSLFRWIVMSVDDYEQNRQSILVHEQEHIRLRHTYDLLLLEALRILQWFNPFIWLLGHDLRVIHEYEADEAVINQGIDAKQYQQLLVMKAMGNRLQPFANTLRRGSLKQRIIMMYQKKSNRWMMLKALFVIPTMGFALYAFATPEVVPEIQNVLDEKVSLPSKVKVESHPKEDVQSLGKDVAYLMENDSNFTVDCSEAKLDKFPVLTLKPEDVLIIDGEEYTLKQLNSLSAEEIDNLTVIKDEKVWMNVLKDILKKHEAKGKAIVIETEKYVKEHGKQSTIGIIQEDEQPTNEVKAGDRISGQVVESPSDGNPLSGAKVSQVTAEGKVVGSTITDANGHFEMPVNDPKNRLLFTKDGYQGVGLPISKGLDMRIWINRNDTAKPANSPQFPGGEKALIEHLSSRLTYPRKAQETGTTGNYFVQLFIDEDGKIEHTSIVATTGYYLESAVIVKGKAPASSANNSKDDVYRAESALKAQCIRAVGTLPRFIPAEDDGKKVDGVFTFSIAFVLS
ncbi:MAG: energy transducer TonB [Bacteroidales bacterium]|nr:energy transducer TonB [Candidatus Physcousia equi]